MRGKEVKLRGGKEMKGREERGTVVNSTAVLVVGRIDVPDTVGCSPVVVSADRACGGNCANL